MDKDDGRNTAELKPSEMCIDDVFSDEFLEKDIQHERIKDWPNQHLTPMDKEIISAVVQIAKRKKVPYATIWREILSRGLDRLEEWPEVREFRMIEIYGKITKKTPQMYRDFFEKGVIYIPSYAPLTDTHVRLEPGFINKVSNVKSELRNIAKGTIWRIIARIGIQDSRIALTDDRETWTGELRAIRKEINSWIPEAQDILQKIARKRGKTPYRKTTYDEVMAPLGVD